MLTLANGNTVQKERKDRTTYIGGSDIAAIMGYSKYKSPLKVYNQKINGYTEPDNTAMRVGRHNENLILDLYEEEMGKEPGIRDLIVCDSKDYYKACQIDWAQNEEMSIITDSKISGQMRMSEYGEEFSSEIPMEYTCQGAYQRKRTGAVYVDFAVLFAPTELKIYRYYENSKFEELIEKCVDEFWHNHILKRIPPVINNSKEFNEIFPESNGLIINVDEMTLNEFIEVNELKNKISKHEYEIKLLKDKKDEKELSIKRTVGANELIFYGGRKIATLKTTHRKGFEVKPSTYRTLRTYL